MHTQQHTYGILASVFCMLFLACGPAQLLGPTTTPLPTQTPIPSSTPTALPSPTLQPSPAADSSDDIYAALLEQVKQADPNFDFTALRMAYAGSEDYDPYSFSAMATKKTMYAALDDKDYETALELANQMLETNYISPDAHVAALYACEGLGQAQEAEFHRYVLKGLIASIMSSGDGKSEETAYVVVLIDEEYLLLDVLGIEHSGQQLAEKDGHMFDMFEGMEKKTNTPVTLYFNVDIPLRWMQDSMQP